MRKVISLALVVIMLLTMSCMTVVAEQKSEHIEIIVNIPNQGNLKVLQYRLSDDSSKEFTYSGMQVQGNGDGTYDVTTTLVSTGEVKFSSTEEVFEKVRINGQRPISAHLTEDGGAVVTGFVYNHSGTHAMQLYTLGIAQGIGTGTDGRPVFDLAAKATRVEAVTMLVRLLGKEQEAKNYEKTHTFTDVPAWADGYVSYAVENGFTMGVSDTLFDSYSQIGTEMYLTFLLRVLGYSDTAGDFVWDNPYELANACKITDFTYDVYEEYYGGFMRAYMFDLSYMSMFSCLKDTETTLYEKLIEEKVFTEKQFEEAAFEK